MPKVRITAMPPGFAPEHIRQAWVGLELPLATDEFLAENPPTGLRIGHDNKDGFTIRTDQAIEALDAAGEQEATEYWQQIGLGSYLVFRQDCCEPIEDPPAH